MGTINSVTCEAWIQLMSVSLGGLVAIDRRDFITFAKLLAGRDHPVCEVEHRPFEPAGFVGTGFEGQLFKPNLFDFIEDSLSVVFGVKFILKVVHLILLWRRKPNCRSFHFYQTFGVDMYTAFSNQVRPSKKAWIALSVFSIRS